MRVYNIKEERFTEEFTDTSLVRWGQDGQDGWGGQVVQSMHVFWAAGTLVKIFTGILKGIVLLVKASSARFRKVLRFQTEGAFN